MKSEIEKYEYYIKSLFDTTYTKYESTEASYTISSLNDDMIYTVYVKAYNKAGYYDQSKTVEQVTLENPDNKVCLYNRGDYNMSFTGGWMFSGGYSPNPAHWTEYDDYMQISCPPYTRSYIRPNNIIDFTEYSILKIVCEGGGHYFIGEATTIGGDPITGEIKNGENRINMKEFTGEKYINLNTSANTIKIYEVCLKK